MSCRVLLTSSLLVASVTSSLAQTVTSSGVCTPEHLSWSGKTATDPRCDGPWKYQLHDKCRQKIADDACPPIQWAQTTCCRLPKNENLESHTLLRSSGGSVVGTCEFLDEYCWWEDTIPRKKICLFPCEFGSACEAKALAAQRDLGGTGRLDDKDYPVENLDYSKDVHVRTKQPPHGQCSFQIYHNLYKDIPAGAECNGVTGARPCNDPKNPIAWEACEDNHKFDEPENCPVLSPARYSAPGLLRSTIANPENENNIYVSVPPFDFCTTRDDVSADDSQKYVRLVEALNNVPPEALSRDANLKKKLVTRLKLLLEMKGDILSKDQRQHIVALYASEAADSSECGRHWTASSAQPTGEKDKAIAREVAGTLELCYRLGDTHVRPEVAEIMLENCVTSIGLAKQLSPTFPGRTEYLQAALDASKKVSVKAFRSLPINDEHLRRPILQSRLKYLNLWYEQARRAEYPGSAATKFWSDVSELTGALWAGMFTNGITGVQPGEADSNAVARILDAGSATDQEMLNILFSEVSQTGSAPLASAPLLFLVADALQSQSDRLKAVAVYHDLGCAILECKENRRISEVAAMHTILAALPDAAQLDLAVSAGVQQLTANRSVLSAQWQAWLGVFQKVIARHKQVLQAAVLDALGTPGGKYDPSVITDTQRGVPPPLVAFGTLIRGISQRNELYLRTGRFLARPSDEIITGLTEAKKSAIVERLDRAVAALEKAKTDYEALRAGLVDSLVRAAQSRQSKATADSKIQQIVADVEQTSRDIEGLRRAAVIESALLADDRYQYGRVLESFREQGNELTTQEILQPFTVNAQDARFRGVRELSRIVIQRGSPWKVLSGKVGQVVNIDVQGTWAPTCALRRYKGKYHDYKLTVPYDAQAGPQGYSLQYSAEGFNVHSDVDGIQHSWNSSINACGGVGLPGVVGEFGLSASVSACTGYSFSESWSESNQTGLQNRESAMFAGGLRLPETPFPDLPAGALLVVLTQPGGLETNERVDVHVLQPPRSSIVFGADADVYLVVNDFSDPNACQPPGPGDLTIRVALLTPKAERMVQLGIAMGRIYSRFSEQANVIVPQGRILPDQIAKMKNDAWQELRVACKCELSEYPEAVRGFFQAWLDAETVRIERAVELLNMRRHIEFLRMQTKALADEIGATEHEVRLTTLLPIWALRSIDVEYLDSAARTVGRLVTEELYPFIRLRYPEALTGSSVVKGLLQDANERAKVERLIQLDWTKQSEAFAKDVKEAVEVVKAKLEESVTAAKPPTVLRVILSFPNPDAAPPDEPYASPWRILDQSRSRSVWRAVRANEPVRIEIRPEDLYPAGAGNSIPCSHVSPVVRKLALYVARPGDSQNDGWISRRERIPSWTSDRMVFPVPAGLRTYRLANPVWLKGETRILYGQELSAADTFVEVEQKDPDVAYSNSLEGISPFTGIEFNPMRDRAPDSFKDAYALLVIFELESRADERGVAGVKSCSPK